MCLAWHWAEGVTPVSSPSLPGWPTCDPGQKALFAQGQEWPDAKPGGRSHALVWGAMVGPASSGSRSSTDYHEPQTPTTPGVLVASGLNLLVQQFPCKEKVNFVCPAGTRASTQTRGCLAIVCNGPCSIRGSSDAKQRAYQNGYD